MARRVLGFTLLLSCGFLTWRILYYALVSPAHKSQMNPIPGLLMLSCFLYVGWKWLRGEVIGGAPTRSVGAGGRPEGYFTDPTDPLWVRGVAKARETASILRELYRAGNTDCGVKFPFQTDSGTIEHVWGRTSEIGEASFKAAIETAPLGHQGALPKELELPLDTLEDWLVRCPDGTMRGGYTTITEIMICERDGLPIPLHIRELKPLLVDAASIDG